MHVKWSENYFSDPTLREIYRDGTIAFVPKMLCAIYQFIISVSAKRGDIRTVAFVKVHVG